MVALVKAVVSRDIDRLKIITKDLCGEIMNPYIRHQMSVNLDLLLYD